jgi:3-oxoacyl-[acyl-carrier-protein] synthase II
MKPISKRVVITGMGAMTPLGNNIAETWKRLIQGETAAGPVEHFSTEGCRCQFAASVKLQNQAKEKRKRSRASRLILPAALEAFTRAGLLRNDTKSSLSWLPMSVSSTGGGMGLGEDFVRGLFSKERGLLKNSRLFQAMRYQPQQQAFDLHEYFDFRGPTTIIANACASGANSIGHAAELIRSGRHECVLTGGWEELSEILFAGFDSLQALTTDCCRPFDQKRSGLMLGEAAAFLVLESEEHAKKRGAKILAELKGYGHSTDLHHLTQPDPKGAALVKAMNMALNQSKLSKSEIGYVNAHGTATVLNDSSECAAFAEFFATDLYSVRISSTKSAIGHTLGAAGSIESIIAIQALLSCELPPQINLREPEIILTGVLASKNEKRNCNAVMSTNLGFGGSNAALIFSRYDS